MHEIRQIIIVLKTRIRIRTRTFNYLISKLFVIIIYLQPIGKVGMNLQTKHMHAWTAVHRDGQRGQQSRAKIDFTRTGHDGF